MFPLPEPFLCTVTFHSLDLVIGEWWCCAACCLVELSDSPEPVAVEGRGEDAHSCWCCRRDRLLSNNCCCCLCMCRRARFPLWRGGVESSSVQWSLHCHNRINSVHHASHSYSDFPLLSSPLSIFILLISLSFNFSGASYSFFCFRQLWVLPFRNFVTVPPHSDLEFLPLSLGFRFSFDTVLISD